jgi:peroxiredoxin
MAVESNMLELGTKAPDFTLPDTVSRKNISLKDVRGEKATVVMFLCNHCPYVLHVNPEIVRLTEDYVDQGVGFVGISSNDVENYPEDGPEKMTTHAAAVGYTFPYLYDESQEVAKAYDAACTPDFYIFDEDLQLVYRGRIDASRPARPARPANGMLNGEDMRAALDAILAGEAVSETQYPSMGCNIKWKSS